MDVCRMSIYLAYGMDIYCIASIYYLVRTRSVGTPFKDSLTPKQIKINSHLPTPSTTTSHKPKPSPAPHHPIKNFLDETVSMA